MNPIIKKVSLVLTEKEINSERPIQIIFDVHSENDMKNKEGVTYTITYPKTKDI